jgi:hypothetical protein
MIFVNESNPLSTLFGLSHPAGLPLFMPLITVHLPAALLKTLLHIKKGAPQLISCGGRRTILTTASYLPEA